MSVTDEIKERLDIVEVISNHVPLKKAGRNYKGLCPFHNEKTPSFVVFPDAQTWHCFGACSTGGDIFTFVMKRENLDFGEALQMLAARAGVELKPRETAASADEQHLDLLRQILAEAAVFFNYLLNRAPEAEIARSYLDLRGLVRETWEGWQLGYTLDSWEALKTHLEKKGFAPAELEETGLIIGREDGSGFYDRFRGRLMIPIRDALGRTIAFGARQLKEDPERPQPKYINSPQGPLFDKSNCLYGLDMARKAIRDENLVVIVEGYMDVLGSHQAGVRNVVAGMGTALTESQLRQVKRHSNNITLALDPDAAGDHAVLRGLETARNALDREWQPVFSPTGLVRQESRLKAQLRIAALPDGLDPDELALSDVQRWRQVIADARPIVDFYLNLVRGEEDLTTARGKANAVERMAPLIGELGSPIEREHYVQQLARLTGSSERLVAERVSIVNRIAAGQARTSGAQRATEAVSRTSGDGNASQPPSEAARAALEEHILGYLLIRPDLLADLDAQMIDLHVPPLNPSDFAGAENRAVLTALQDALPIGEEWRPQDLSSTIAEALHPHLRKVLERAQQLPTLTDEKIGQDLIDSLIRLRARNLGEQIEHLEVLILECQDTGDREQLRTYQDAVESCKAQIRHVQKLRFNRSMSGALALASAQGRPTHHAEL